MCGQHVYGQNTDTVTVTTCPVKDIKDILSGKKEKAAKPPKNHYLLVTPVISSSPATGFVLGFASQLAFKGADPADKYSILSGNAQYTTKNQALFNIKNNVFLLHNKLFLSGDWRLFLFSQPTYGLGTDILNNDSTEGGFAVGDQFIEPDSIAEPMRFNYIKFHQSASWKIVGDFYLGGGVHFDIYDKIVDEKLDTANGVFTHHYDYSVKYGFNPNNYSLNGLSINGVIDTRDNQLNATKGWFANLNWRFNPGSASRSSSSLLFAEMRYFKSFNIKKGRHTIGVWAWGNFVTSGHIPYLTLPAIGWDQRSRSGRGYAQGLFRGYSMMYGEFEYRFPISCNHFLSGVVFANATTASDRDRDIKLFRYIKPAVGVGLRLLMDKTTETNLVLDFAKGRKSGGFYLNAGETF